jgi:hypothetical protein
LSLPFCLQDINQFIASAVAEKVSAIATEEYLQARAQRADKSAFEPFWLKSPNASRYRGMSCKSALHVDAALTALDAGANGLGFNQ